MARPLVFLAMLGVLLLIGGFLVSRGHDQPTPLAGMAVGEDLAAPAVSPGVLSSAASLTEKAAGEPSAATDEPNAPGRSIVGITLHGRIADGSGRAVEQGSLVLFNGQGDVRVARLEPGRAEYEIAGVTPGRWTASVMADGYADHNADIELLGSSGRVRHDVVLEQGALDVRLETPQGQSLLDAIRESLPGRTIEILVIATRGHPGARVPSLSPGDGSLFAGRYQRNRFPDPDRPIDGTIRLVGLPPVHVSAVFQRSVLATVHVPCATREVVLVVPLARVRAELGSLRARFVDADTAHPVRGAAAVLIDAESPPVLQGRGSR